MKLCIERNVFHYSFNIFKWCVTLGNRVYRWKRIGYAWNKIQIPLFTTFYWNMNTDSNVFEYEYKTDVSNSDTHSDIYSIWRQHLPIFFIGNLQLQNHVKTKILVHNRDSSLRISHSSIFILIINHIINKTINKYIFWIYIYIYTFIKK
jgi:hypothetical protein